MQAKGCARAGAPGALLLCLLPLQAAQAESRTYAVGMFHIATYSDGRHGPGTNCPHGGNGVFLDVERRILQNQFGYSPAAAQKILVDEKDKSGRSLREIIRDRGTLNGRRVSIYNYPLSAPKTKDYTVEGRHAYGFDLDGKGPDQPHSFEDPETHAKGVDNGLFRAVGCYTQYDINLPQRPSYEESVFITGLPVIPAWLITLSADHLDRDGAVTVSFHKAIEHPRVGADGTLLRGATYTIDPNPRSHGELAGQIAGGVLTAQGGEVLLEGEAPILVKLHLYNTHLRLKLNSDGTAGGYIGGYEPWLDYWFMAAFDESNVGMDLSTLYWNLSEFAEAKPDPVTGKNTAISATFRIDAVEAFVAPAPAYVAPRHVHVQRYVKAE